MSSKSGRESSAYSYLRRALRFTKLTLLLQGYKGLMRIGPPGWFLSAFVRDHPRFEELRVAHKYNLERSKEARVCIIDTNRVLNLISALEMVKGLSEGDYAEFGTYRGLTARIIWSRKAEHARLYCFDTFEGFADEDLSVGDARLETSAERERFKDTSLQDVVQRIGGGDSALLQIRKGYFPETFAGLEQATFRFVHIDVDLAQPIAAGLELFWPRIVRGGVVMVHDYYSPRYPMARETVDRFFLDRGIRVFPLNDRLGTGFVMKG